ncbi:MAG: glycosyltransferase family 4 protein [Planctomycetaceae bacterium]|nr:glycosyltransferase family 4 protein [Planctomycetaceae bacterium]
MKISLVSLPAYPVVDPTASGVFGGTETRAVTLARSCARNPQYEIHFFARHPALTTSREIDQVHWHSWPDPQMDRRARIAAAFLSRRTFPFIHFSKLTPQLLLDIPLVFIQQLWTRLMGQSKVEPALNSVETDLFAAFGVHSVSHRVMRTAHALGKPFVLLPGSDADLDPAILESRPFRTRYGERSEICAQVIQQADLIFVQNEYQQTILSTKFSRDSSLLLNPIDLKAWDLQASHCLAMPLPDEPFVLWMGRAERFHKRADLALEIALQTPDIPYLFVINPADDELLRELQRKRPANVQFVSRIPFAEVSALMSRARLLLNTSSKVYEGFPNVLLQASASSLPILSLEVDPGYLTAANAGIVISQQSRSAADVLQELFHDPQQLESMGRAGREYVHQQHQDQLVADQFLKRVAELTRKLSGKS